MPRGDHAAYLAVRAARLAQVSEQPVVSQTFDPDAWDAVEGFEFTDITYHRARGVGAVRIAFDRPEVLNAFRPHTVDELYQALDHARRTPDVGVVLLTGNGPGPEGSGSEGQWAFCSGGDQRIRGRSGYQYAREATPPRRSTSGGSRPRAGGCTSSRCSGSSAPCPRSSSPSSAAGRPVAATRCTSSAT